jgi:hypothetical protein
VGGGVTVGGSVSVIGGTWFGGGVTIEGGGVTSGTRLGGGITMEGGGVISGTRFGGGVTIEGGGWIVARGTRHRRGGMKLGRFHDPWFHVGGVAWCRGPSTCVPPGMVAWGVPPRKAVPPEKRLGLGVREPYPSAS